MKVSTLDTAKAVTAPTAHAGNAAHGAATKATGSAVAPAASTTVALSAAAASLVNESNADFDAAKVARIAQAIRDGKFSVNAEAIADKLIDHTRDLLRGSQH